MYKENAVKRLKNIKWKNVETVGLNEFTNLGDEFFSRLAKFYKENSIKPLTPIFSNIAWLLGDKQEFDIYEFETEQMKVIFDSNLGIRKICTYYIQLSQYVDQNKEAEKYIDIYEPLIEILEKGGSFILNTNEMDIYKTCCFSLRNWYVNFLC